MTDMMCQDRRYLLLHCVQYRQLHFVGGIN